MKGVQDGINASVGWCVSVFLVTCSDIYVDDITIGLDKVIELDFKLEGLVTVFGNVINYVVGCCVDGWLGTGFDWYADAITFGVDIVIDLGFSDRFFYGCNDCKLEGHVT